jgi:isopenicillin N synthase-like dioxygenase
VYPGSNASSLILQGCEQVGPRYFAALERVVVALNRMSATALQLAPDFFDPFFAPGDYALRLAHYPPMPAEAALHPGQLRYGAHTDYQGFTVLLQDDRDEGVSDAGGLEVLLSEAEPERTRALTEAGELESRGEGRMAWMAVKPLPGCFVVNVGDLYELWTNGRWKSTIHRVTNPPHGHEAARCSRLAVPYFTGPGGNPLIEALPTCVDATHPALYAPVGAHEHLLSTLTSSNL